jgi:hypothetical protein
VVRVNRGETGAGVASAAPSHRRRGRRCSENSDSTTSSWTPGLRRRRRPAGVESPTSSHHITAPSAAVQHLHTSTTPPKRPELDRTQPGLAGVDEGEQPEAPETVVAGGDHANPQLGIAPAVQAGAWRGRRRWGFCGGGQVERA